MKIILKEDIVGLGYKNDIVEVKNGYGRNFLIPQGKAFLATASMIKVAEENARQFKRKEQNIINEAQEVANKISEMTLSIGTKAGSNGKIFGSVTNIQVAQALKDNGIDVDRRKIKLRGDIKELGNYQALVSLYKGIDAELSLEVVQE
jgi:large subunit ribosomal protein L9